MALRLYLFLFLCPALRESVCFHECQTATRLALFRASLRTTLAP